MPELSREIASRLRTGAQELSLALSSHQETQLLEYLALLVKWNRAYNLTAVRDPQEMVIRHLLDSLAIARWVQGKRLIDVGTGAGLPGVPLAILYPERAIHLLDSNGKKTRFLFQVKTSLGLDNMSVHHSRVESYQPDQLFEGILSRAFASMQDMVQGCQHLLSATGCFFAMKGSYPTQELAAVEATCLVQAIHVIAVPGLAEQRHLVQMTLR